MYERTCPNCGAPKTSFECKYCGATFYDFANLSFDKPVYIRFKHRDGNVWLMKGFLNNMDVEMSATGDISIDTGFEVMSAQFIGRTE